LAVSVPRAPDTHVEVVDRWYAAYTARDAEAMCRLVHPEVEIIPVYPLLTKLPGTTFRGHDGVRSLVQWSFENYPRLRVESSRSENVRGLILGSATFVVDDRPTPVVKRHTDTLFELEGDLIRRARTFLRHSDAVHAAQIGFSLTVREREIFRLLAQGMNAPEIAEQLVLSPATVRTHVQNGTARLGARTRIQAVALALKRREIQM
jgi:DNA-binding CsgD family transcriptional regulator